MVVAVVVFFLLLLVAVAAVRVRVAVVAVGVAVTVTRQGGLVSQRPGRFGSSLLRHLSTWLDWRYGVGRVPLLSFSRANCGQET